MATPRSPSPETLLAETRWLRALARSLVGDAHRADDLVQETWLAALRHPPDGDRPLRAWLARVLRNAFHQSHRSDARRTARERAGREHGRSERSAPELLERVSAHRRLADAVMTLDEPYRTAIVLRYFEDAPPRELARRLGVPVATVKSRLARGLEKLRARLDAEQGGDRRAWVVAFLPLARSGAELLPGLAGAALMNQKVVLPLAAVLLVGAFLGGRALLLAPSATETSPSTPPPAVVAPAEPRAGTAPVVASTGATSAEREVLRGAPTPPAAAVAPAPRRVRGRVFHADGHALTGFRIGVAASDEEHQALARPAAAESGLGGAFEIDVPADGARLLSADPAFTTVLAGVARLGSPEREPTVVVAPRLAVGGRVVDASGAAVAGAVLALELPSDFRARFPVALDFSEVLEPSTISDDEGRFALSPVASTRGTTLAARHDGFVPAAQPLPEVSDLALRVVLERPAEAAELVSGTVVDPGGVPVAGARVSFGLDATTTDDAGTFRFVRDDPRSWNTRFGATPRALLAVQRGFLPAEHRPAPEPDGSIRWPRSVTLRLGGETRAVAGVVLDPKGAPLPGACVWVDDPTFFGVGSRGGPTHVESLLAGEGDSGWRRVEADLDGKFRIDGLLDRAYTLRAIDPATLLQSEPVVAAPGTENAVVRMPIDGLFPRVAGTVRSRDGKPIAGVHVRPQCDPFRTRFEGQVIGTHHEGLEGVVTDAEGRFALRDVPKTLAYLRLDGDTILPVEFGRHVEGGLAELSKGAIEKLDVRVPMRCHFRVELPEDAARGEIAVLDASGAELSMNLIQASGRWGGERFAVGSGGSDVLAVEDSGVTIVLYRDGVEAMRRPVALVPGEIVSVRF